MAVYLPPKLTQQSQNLIDKAMERLSTGKRINYAKDDAAGSAIAVRLTAEIQGLAVASRNAADGQSLLDTAEGALQETQTLLDEIKRASSSIIKWNFTTSDKRSARCRSASS